MPTIRDTRDDDLLQIVTYRNGNGQLEQALSWTHVSPMSLKDPRCNFTPQLAEILHMHLHAAFEYAPKGRFVIEGA